MYQSSGLGFHKLTGKLKQKATVTPLQRAKYKAGWKKALISRGGRFSKLKRRFTKPIMTPVRLVGKPIRKVLKDGVQVAKFPVKIVQRVVKVPIKVVKPAVVRVIKVGANVVRVPIKATKKIIKIPVKVIKKGAQIISVIPAGFADNSGGFLGDEQYKKLVNEVAVPAVQSQTPAPVVNIKQPPRQVLSLEQRGGDNKGMLVKLGVGAAIIAGSFLLLKS